MYNFEQEDVFKISNWLNADTKQKGNELFYKHCPYCHGNGHDEYTFSINLENGAFKCFRNSCGKQGHLVELARDFDYNLQPPKTFKTLPQKIEVRNAAVEYMRSRGISESITTAYKITTQKNNDNVLVFPFYDENNVMRFVKYRNAKHQKGQGNKEWCEKDCKPILFGMAQCEDFKQVIITEGQIDSLTLAECGIKNAVSVPTGAKGFTWLSYCEEWLNKFEKIVVFGDLENGKMSLIDELRNRMPKKNIYNIKHSHYLGEKDANDIYRKFGADAIRKAVNSAECPENPHIKQLADVANVDISDIERLSLDIAGVDKVLDGFMMGLLYVISGKAGEGKSTFASQILAKCLENGKRIFAYSGELPNWQFKKWLDLQLAGGERVLTTINQYGNEEYHLPTEDIKTLNNWYRDRAYIYDNTFVEDEIPDLLDILKDAICRYGCEVILIDNLMTAIETDADKMYHQQASFSKALSDICKVYGVTIILIAHPKKTKESKFENDDISGSSEVAKRADIVMNFKRNNKQENEGDADAFVEVTKNRVTGRLAKGDNAIDVYYSVSSRRICGRELKQGNDIFKTAKAVKEELPF